MARRLIIRHGERMTRHELADKAIVIGRDPSCDLFFSDHKLSRRHARVEPKAERVKLVDLGSRNGCWVNEQKVEEHVLEPEDTIRLGGLRITYEEDPPVSQQEVTLVLAESAAADDDGQTLKLNGLAPERDRSREVEPPDDTVLFAESRAPDQDRTVHLPDGSPPVDDTGTVMFPGRAEDTTHASPVLEKTKPMDRESAFPPGGVSVEEPSRVSVSSSVPILVLLGVALASYALLVIPLVFKTRSDLHAESLLRGRTLLSLLRTANAAALSSGELHALSVEAVLGEPGVKEALLLDLDGRVLAPRNRAGETYETIEGIDEPPSKIDAYRQGRNGAGDYNLVAPLTHEGHRVGIAVVTYSLAAMAEAFRVSVFLMLGIIVLIAGAWGAHALAKKADSLWPAKDTETTLPETPGPPQ